MDDDAGAATVVLRSDLRGLWLFAGVFVVVIASAGGAAESGAVGWLAVAGFGLLVGAGIHGAMSWWYGRNAVVATTEGLVDVRRGWRRTTVPWSDVEWVSVNGGNFWTFANSQPEPGWVTVGLRRPMRATYTDYPARTLGSCLIVKGSHRLTALAEAQEALRAQAPAAVRVGDRSGD